jgi:hypothetical protein
MSYDLKLQNACDHLIQWVSSTLSSDQKTVNLPYPLSSSSSLKVRVNNVIIPSDIFTVTTLRNNITNLVNSRVIFNNKIKDFEPIVELKYVTLSVYCPKCLGNSVVDDFFVEGHGDYKTISKELLLLQQLEKIIVTKLSSNSFHDWYGSNIHSFVGKKISDRDLLNSKIKDQIGVAIEKLKNIQKQMISSGRKFDDGELFGRLLDIEIKDTEDPTILEVIVYFTSKRESTLEYTQYLSLDSSSRQRVVIE